MLANSTKVLEVIQLHEFDYLVNVPLVSAVCRKDEQDISGHYVDADSETRR